MNDNQLLHLIEEVDTKLVQWGTVNKLAPLSLSGVLLGRILLMVQNTGCEDDFWRLVDSIQNDPSCRFASKVDDKLIH
jgi:hypothetical protein